MPGSMRWRWRPCRYRQGADPAPAARGAQRAGCGRDPVSVLAVETVADDWHARFSCTAGAISTGSSTAARRWRLTPARRGISAAPLDADGDAPGGAAIWSAARFHHLRSAHCQSESPVKTLDALTSNATEEEIHIRAAARSFLHHQVRSMVGCLALVGRGRWKPEDIREALEARDRAAWGSMRRRKACISSRRSTPRS